jgi:uncharacterized protein (DUF58 family)
MIRPTRRTLLLALCGCPVAVLPALCGGGWWIAWVAFTALSVLALGLDRALLPATPTLALELPEVLFLGDAEPLRLHLASAAPRSHRVEVVVDVSGELEPPAAVQARCGGGETAALLVPLRPRRRGTVAIERLWLRWPGPLGLLQRTSVHGRRQRLQVVTDVRPLKAQALRFFARTEFQVGLKVEHFLGDGSEFEALREFVPGFDRRAVDWKATARHGKVLCREYRAERNHQIVLAVDCGHLMAEPLAGLPRVDHAIAAAMLLAYVGLKTGDCVGTFTFDDRPRTWLRPESGLRALPAVQRALSRVDYSSAETNFTYALTDLLTHCRRRTLVVLFTEFADSITAQLMVPNLDRLARRHLVLFVVMRDPLLQAVLTGSPQAPIDLHRVAVAADLQREQDVVLERIRRSGVQVIEADARDIGPQLINRYLELKRRESL